MSTNPVTPTLQSRFSHTVEVAKHLFAVGNEELLKLLPALRKGAELLAAFVPIYGVTTLAAINMIGHAEATITGPGSGSEKLKAVDAAVGGDMRKILEASGHPNAAATVEADLNKMVAVLNTPDETIKSAIPAPVVPAA